MLNDCLVDKVLTPGIRVTVKLKPNQGTTIIIRMYHGCYYIYILFSITDLKSRKLLGTIVSPSQPRFETGIYWGYSVRVATSLSEIFLKSPYDNGYDLTIGTSDKGDNVHEVDKNSMTYNHALIVYGGLQGLESALESDDKLNVDDPSLLFHQYLNTVPGQGTLYMAFT